MSASEIPVHSPLPWIACKGGPSNMEGFAGEIPPTIRRQFIDEQGRRNTQFIAELNTVLPEARANAEFIVRACNSHDDLLAALKGLLAIQGVREVAGQSVFGSIVYSAEAAIARAGHSASGPVTPGANT